MIIEVYEPSFKLQKKLDEVSAKLSVELALFFVYVCGRNRNYVWQVDTRFGETIINTLSCVTFNQIHKILIKDLKKIISENANMTIKKQD